MRCLIICITIFTLSTPEIVSQWFPQNSGTSDNFKNVEFISSNIGWTGSEFKIYKTNDGGTSWYIQKDFTPEYIISLFFINENTGWLLSYYSLDLITKIYKTIDGGDTWQLKNLLNDTQLVDLDFVNDSLGWCVGSGGMPPLSWVPATFKTTDSGETWESVSVSPTYFSYLRSVEFVDELEGWISGANNIFKTSDGGQNWIEMPYVSGGADAVKLQFLNSDTGWSATDYGGLFKTTDGGINWTQQTDVQSVNFYFVNQQMGWSVFGSSIYHTTNGGDLWTSQYSNTTNFLWDISFVDFNKGWATGDSGTILYTINGGIPVELISFTADVTDNNILLNWTTATETNNKGFGIERSQKPAFGEVSLKSGSKVKSQKWDDIGFVEGNGTTTEKHSYRFVDNAVNPGIYSYRLKQTDFDGSFNYSKVVKVLVTVPTKYSLEQNYPNPFNPMTTICYKLPVKSVVTLKVYNTLGEEVATLVNAEKPPGRYEMEFEGSGLPSGVYIYRLNAGSYTAAKKLLLVK